MTPGAQWDVDNDGDGVPDSVWVDLGMPVRSTADGHLYKPLFAMLCVDLDGRLNLNAHGCLAQTGGPAATDLTNYSTYAFPLGGQLAGGGSPDTRPRPRFRAGRYKPQLSVVGQPRNRRRGLPTIAKRRGTSIKAGTGRPES